MLSIAGELRLPATTGTMEPSMRAATGESERCPRCGSHNTKFCYYNNYNLAQPRYFCKSCRRYWTLGGSLRNVPVGGSTRSNPVSSPHHSTKQPHHSSAATSFSKRRRASSAGPSPTSASRPPPSSTYNAPAFDIAPSGAAPVPVAAKTELGNFVEPASVDILGSYVSLLTEPLPAGGFLAPPLGEHLVHGRDDEYGLALGFGGGPKWAADEVGFGMARPAQAWPLFVGYDGAASLFGTGVMGDGGLGGITGERDLWHAMAKGTELVGGDCGGCFGWPELGTTTMTSGKAV